MKVNQITFRVKSNEIAAIQGLSNLLERNVSDTVRFAIRKTARDYGLLPEKPESPEIQAPQLEPVGE